MFFRCRYPPYSESKLKMILQLTKRRAGIPGIKYLRYLLVFGLGVFVTIGFNIIMKVQKKNRTIQGLYTILRMLIYITMHPTMYLKLLK